MPRPLLILGLALLGPVTQAGLVSETSLDGEVDESTVNPASEFGELYVGHAWGSHNRVIVTPFKLPYIAPGQTITGATVTWNLHGHRGSPNVPLDVYGLTRISTSGDPRPADFYIGPNDAANTRLAAGFVSPSTPPGHVTLANPALVDWLNKQAARARTAEDHYVFLRFNGSDHEDQHAPGACYVFSSSDCPRPDLPTLTITVSGTPQPAPDRLQFSFQLPRDETTSAGIYRGPRLLRTLWNNVPATAGANFGVWDGLDDSGAPVNGDCQVRVLTHNVGYTWEGVIGNTSRDNQGLHVWRAYGEPLDLDIAGTTAYSAVGYNEGQSLFNSFQTTDPQVLNQIYNNEDGHNDPFSDIHLVAADDHMSWWVKGRGGMGGTYTFVFALDADHHLHNFPQGDVVPPGQKYHSCFDLDTSSVGDDKQPNQATGIAVQKNGRFIFVAHGNLNVVRIFDKLTGAKAGTIEVPVPGRCACDPAGNLYVLSQQRVMKFAIDADGHAGPPQELVRGLSSPLAIACDPVTNVVAVADDGHVRAYDHTTGAVVWTYGHRQVTPKIEPDAFYFRKEQAAIAFQPDGSLWVGDSLNSRLCHYAVQQRKVTFLEQVIYQSVQYICAVDQNAPSHCFCGYEEFVQDFTKPLAGNNGSWTLVNNWAAGLLDDAQHHYYGGFDGIQNAMTLSNGRRYALLGNSVTHMFDLFELPASGPARRTGISMDSGSGRYRMAPDFSLRHARVENGRVSFYAQPLQGFDAEANPHWGPPVLLGSAPVGAPGPIPDEIGLGIRVEVTPSRVIPVYGNAPTARPFYHFGTIALGGTDWLNRAMPDAPGSRTRKGKLPRDGHFDSGNGVQYAGNVLTAFGRNCFLGYNGEFWRQGQASTDYHFLDDGLMVGSFGVPGQFVPLNQALAGFAGNNFTQEIGYDPGTRTLHLWCDDESNHGGISRWRIDNLDSMIEHTGTGHVGQVIEVK